NLIAGTQAVLVGRYDPTQSTSSGEVRIRGRLPHGDLEYRAPVTLAGAEKGNSFIPRLWARRQLDHLLRQGRSPGIKEQIIVLSEDFQIITPYTSFLVLESEEDRERFRVKKRFRMRDGEEFFSEGRDRAEFELTRKQMRLARQWRRQLRTQILRSFQTLGREITEALKQTQGHGLSYVDNWNALGMESGALGGMQMSWHNSVVNGAVSLDGFDPSVSGPEGEKSDNSEDWDERETDTEINKDEEVNEILSQERLFEPEDAKEQMAFEEQAKPRRSELRARMAKKSVGGGGKFYASYGARGQMAWNRRDNRYLYGDPLNSLFPAIPAPTTPPAETRWPEEILELVKPLNRRTRFQTLEGALSITVSTLRQDSRQRVIGQVTGESLIARDGWWVTGPHLSGDQIRHDWVFGEERGALLESWLLGRLREKHGKDLNSWSDPFLYYFKDLARTYSTYDATLQRLPDGTVRLTLRPPKNQNYLVEYLLDPQRSLILEVRGYRKDQHTSSTLFSGFVEVAGSWWPTRITFRNGEGQVTRETHVTIKELSRVDFEERMALRLQVCREAIMLGKAPESISAAKQAVRSGNARFEDHWALLRIYAARQMSSKLDPHRQAILKRTAGKRGQKRLELALLLLERRNEEAKKCLFSMAETLAASPRVADRDCALEIYRHASVLHGNERLDLVERLQSVHERQSRLEALFPYHQQIYECQQSMGWAGPALQSLRLLTEQYPYEVQFHTQYASRLSSQGEVDPALAHLSRIEEQYGPWPTHQIQSLRSSGTQILFNSWRIEQVVEYLEIWQQQAPEQISASLLNQYLSALIMLDRERRAEALITEWLEESSQVELSAVAQNRRSAALQHALGQGWNLYRRRFEERWSEPLGEVARFYVDHPTQIYIAGQILQNRGFAQSEEGVQLLRELFQKLKKDLGSLTYAQIASLTGWLRHQDQATHAVSQDWQDIFALLLERWVRSGEDDLNQQVQQVIVGHAMAPLKLRYWRQRIAVAANPPRRTLARQALFSLLLEQPWSDSG
ncbi:MAG: hypothetical protein V3T77_00315, partial [Planctomycetota bacterium]